MLGKSEPLASRLAAARGDAQLPPLTLLVSEDAAVAQVQMPVLKLCRHHPFGAGTHPHFLLVLSFLLKSCSSQDTALRARQQAHSAAFHVSISSTRDCSTAGADSCCCRYCNVSGVW